jgi:hypothetical protein
MQKKCCTFSWIHQKHRFLTCEGIAKKLYQCKKYISPSWISSAEPLFSTLLFCGDIVKYQYDKKFSEQLPSRRLQKKDGTDVAKKMQRFREPFHQYNGRLIGCNSPGAPRSQRPRILNRIRGL